MGNIINKSKRIIFIVCLVSVAVIWRIINHKYSFAPNLELVTSVSALAAVTFGWRAALIVPLATMVLSDLIIGNSSIFIFTWSSFVIIGAIAVLLKRLNSRPKAQIFYSLGFAIVSSLLFFVITNFGVWAQGWYPGTWTGLVTCFINAIPFYRTMLIGNMILVPTVIVIWQLVRARQTAKSLVINSLIGN